LTIKALKELNGAAHSGEKIAVAVSGGRDSMCLLRFMLDNYDLSRLSVVHIEHGIRGEESVRDAKFVRDYCKKHSVEIEAFSVNVPKLAKEQGVSEETAARLYRKKVFASLIESGKADLIALAHHELDQVETVLMHVFRGSGISGLKGMSAKDGYIIRPFIRVSTEELDEYASRNSIEYRTDSTNSELDYNRNFVRNKIIPLISERFDVVKSVVRLSENAREDDELINSILDLSAIERGEDERSIAIEKLGNNYAILTRYAVTMLKEIGLACDLEKKHFEALFELVSLDSGSEVHLPHGYVAVKDYQKLTFYKAKTPVFDEIEYAVGITPFSDGYICVSSADGIKKGEQVFDGDKIPSGAIIRFRREGDKFIAFGGGTKKLKEYLIDKKIPRRKRDGIPLLCDGNNVLVICGVEISDSVKIDERTVNRLKITYSEE